MARRFFKANAIGAIANAGGISAGATSLTLEAGQGALFPDTDTEGMFVIRSEQEMILVEDRDGDTLNFPTASSRGFNGTTPAAHAQGAEVVNVLAPIDAAATQAEFAMFEGQGYGPSFAIFNGSILNGIELEGNRTFYEPIRVGQETTINRLWTYVIDAGAGGGAIGMCLHRDADGVPGKRLIVTGTDPGTTPGSVLFSFSDIVIIPGIYWLGVGCNNGYATLPNLLGLMDAQCFGVPFRDTLAGNGSWRGIGFCPEVFSPALPVNKYFHIKTLKL